MCVTDLEMQDNKTLKMLISARLCNSVTFIEQTKVVSLIY